MKKWYVDDVFVRDGKTYDRGYYICEEEGKGWVEWTEPIRNGETHLFDINECTHRDGSPIMIEDGELIGSLKMIQIKVENSGLYGKGIEGTWEDLREELALQIPDWHTYEVERYGWHGNKRSYWGSLFDESGNEKYRFWAIFDEDEGEIEVESVENE